MAARLLVFLASDTAPAVRQAIGSVEGLGCEPQRDYPLNVEIQKVDALNQLRLRAAKMNAEGVVGVQFEKIATTDRRNACFRGLTARGEAVTFKIR